MRQREDERKEEVNPKDPQGKRPVGQKKKKKKKSTTTGTLTLVPLKEEEEAMQLTETIQRNTVEKMATNVPYLKGVGLLGYELQKKALEEVV